MFTVSRAIQGQLPAAHKLDHDETSARKGFVRLMLQGNVKGALKCLQGLSTGGVLDLNAELANGNTVLRELPEKHPDAAPAGPNTLLFGPVNLVDPVIFQSIDAELVRTICLQTTGAAGVSGLDSSAWRRICCSFGSASSTLCQAIARLTRLLATTRVDSDGISALLAGRLIPLDKNPGVRPIGVREVLRRIIAKLILRVTKHRIQECAGSLQLCAGQEAGIEAAVHALRKVFVDDATDGLLLVDAFNAFNSINREALLHNINVLCPALSTVMKNFTVSRLICTSVVPELSPMKARCREILWPCQYMPWQSCRLSYVWQTQRQYSRRQCKSGMLTMLERGVDSAIYACGGTYFFL